MSFLFIENGAAAESPAMRNIVAVLYVWEGRLRVAVSMRWSSWGRAFHAIVVKMFMTSTGIFDVDLTRLAKPRRILSEAFDEL